MKKLYVLTMAAVLAGWSVMPASAADPATKGEAKESAPDNTGRNVRDRADTADTVTSGDQSEAKAHLETTQRIRQAVVADDSLSTTAHNVKIITTEDGAVTLRGPVKSEDERKKIGAMAEQVAGAGRVRNHLEVAPPK
jgi:osmotically-inducible protein OsmY